MNPEQRKLEDIEVLRAVAIILTIAIHLTYLFPEWGSAVIYRYLDFRVGVDLFFVISGFVIAQSALPRLTMAHAPSLFWRNAIAFWLRRAWRIWPSAWLWLAVIVACTLFLNESGVFGGREALRGTLREVVASLLQVMNFSMLDTQILRPGSVTTSTGATFPYWSLSLEEQFYIALPLVIFATRKYLPIALLIVAAAMFALPKGQGTAWFFARYDPIVIGVLLAIWKQHPTYALLEPRFLAGGPFRGIAFTLNLSLLAAAAAGLGVVPFAYGLISVVFGLLVFAASFGKNYLFPSGRVREVLLWVGSRSYAIYLCHAILFLVTRELWFRYAPPASRLPGDDYTLRYLLTALVFVGLASELNYRLVERPLRAKGRRLAEAMESSASAPAPPASSSPPSSSASPATQLCDVTAATKS